MICTLMNGIIPNEIITKTILYVKHVHACLILPFLYYNNINKYNNIFNNNNMIYKCITLISFTCTFVYFQYNCIYIYIYIYPDLHSTDPFHVLIIIKI